jgi:adenine specific DNA methylase Mod
MAKIEKVDLKSKDIKSEQVERLKKIFPEIVADGKINFEQLKATLGEDVEDSKERFGMTWAGKSKCFRIIQDPSTGTLKPSRKESVNFDTTDNLFIEGDNLEVLKLLQKSYYEKVKMIYIDPPYNTGKDFVYPDNFGQQLDEYLKITGQVDDEGKKLSTNADTGGRYHSNWMNMMYPRLFLSRNLLQDDGVIFISIDDNEVDNLMKICDEIFGEENFIAQIPRITKKSGKSTESIAKNNDYVLIYGKSSNTELNQFEHTDDGFKNTDDFVDSRGKFKLNQTLDYNTLGYIPSLDYEIKIKEGIFYPGGVNKSQWEKRKKENPKDDFRWRWSKKLFDFGYKNGFIVIKKYDGGKTPRIYTKTYQNATIKKDANKNYFIEYEKRTTPLTTLEFINNKYSNDNAKKAINEVLENNVFDYSKPVSLIKKLIELSTNNKDMILDFFAGSGTTAQATLELNKKQISHRKFICIQLPELTDKSSESYKAGYKTIADISKERIRRVIKKLEKDSKLQKLTGDKKIDLGFRVFKLDISNFKKWDNSTEELQTSLTEHVEQIKTSANPEDVLYEILIKDGFELTTKIEKTQLKDKDVFSIENNLLLICLNEKLDLDLFKEMKKLDPHLVIVLDKGFKDNDQLKTNAVQTLGKNSDEEYILRSI